LGEHQPKSARAAASLVLVVIGYSLVIPGQLATVYYDEASTRVVALLGAVGQWFLSVTWSAFPPGAFFAVFSILIGTLLIAVGAAAGSRPLNVDATAIRRHSRAGLLPAWALLSMAAGLAAVTLYICRSPRPSNLAVATWVASMLCGVGAFAWIDRARGMKVDLRFDRWTEVAVVVLLTLVSFVVVAHDLTHWRWSGTPDETHFFGVAKGIATGTAERFLLSERGVFEVHPTLSSVYQSLFMMVFGVSDFSWRLSSAAALVIAVPLLYLLARRLWNERVAVVAALLFGTTPAAVGFGHLGYNNTQIYPVVVGSLLLVAWAHRHGSVVGLYLAGCLSGLGFYTFYPARLTLLLVLVLGLCFGALPVFRRDRMPTFALFAGLLLALVPVAAHPLETLGRMFQFTSFTGGGALRAADFDSVWQLISAVAPLELLNQSFLSLIYSVYFIGPHHFQWPPVVDPVSGPLTLVGLWLCIGGVRRGNARFLAVAFIVSAVLIGGTSHYFRPPLTRLLFLSPFAALLAAVALDRLSATVCNATRSPRLAAALGGVLTTLAVVLAIASLQYNVRYRYHGYGDGTTAELVRLAQSLPEDLHVVYVQRPDTSMWSVDGIFDSFGMRERLSYFQGLSDKAIQALESRPPPFVVVLSLAEAQEIGTVEEILRRRFPHGQWQSSDAGEAWSLRYFVAAES
jgi:hypothetical protein